jgi:hypothetical protein
VNLRIPIVPSMLYAVNKSESVGVYRRSWVAQ